MNETLKTIDLRRSTRAYSEQEITKEEREVIITSAINAPTAGNMVLYSIIDVVDQEKKEKLSVLCDNQPFIKTGKLVLLFVTDAYKWYHMYNEINGTNLEPTLSDFYLGMADAHIAAQNAVIAAESLGIGSCYIGDIVENYEEVKQLFNLPKYINPICLLIFGHKKDDKVSQRPLRFKLEDVVFENAYTNKSKEVFVNKFNHLNDLNLQTEKAKSLVNGTFNHKQHAEFFKEMNRSLKLMIDEYIENNI